MIFSELRVENFGLFFGQHTFDLEPVKKWGQHCPIVLFGGKNGAGKTTILEAIMLCVHGRRSLGDRVTENEYLGYLRGRIHRAKGGDALPLKRASVSLDFRQTHFGIERTYRADRTWRIRDQRVEESLELTVISTGAKETEDSLVDEIGETLTQDFLDDLFPVGIAKLFFFDGEKIQDLAQDEEQGERLGAAIKEMLNLDIVERLQADLKTHVIREKRKTQAPAVAKSLTALESQVEDLTQQRSDLQQSMAGVETRRKQKVAEVDREEQAFRTEGGAYASRLGELQERHARTEADLEGEREALRSLSAGVLPFALVSEMCQELAKQLERERALGRWEAGKEALTASEESALQALVQQLGIDDEMARRAFQVVTEAVSIPADIADLRRRHEKLSDRQAEDILGWLRNGIGRSAQEAGQRAKKAEKTTRELNRVAMQLNKAPDEDVATVRLAAIKDLTHALGELEQEKKMLSEELVSIDDRLSQASRQHGKALLGLRSSRDVEEKGRLASKVQAVLERFGSELSVLKTSQLESEGVAALAALHRKEDVIRGMDIDPQTFAVSLLGKGNRTISKKELSAGEKQMYAVAMLWALARTSGRPLPVVIDTPLGRLDSDHRRNLVENYFPKASHQVIILSTDTEVDSKYFEDLRKFVSHSYHLKYNPLNMETEVDEGYFWTSKNGEEEIDPDKDDSLLGSLGAA